MAYVTIASTDYDPDSPITTTLAGAWSNNLEEAFAAATGAPKLQPGALANFGAGNRWQALDDGAQTSNSYFKRSEFHTPRGGAIRVRLVISANHGGVQVYKNGSPAGTERTTTGTFDEDFSVTANDLIQVYAKGDGTDSTTYIAYIGVNNPNEISVSVV